MPYLVFLARLPCRTFELSQTFPTPACDSATWQACGVWLGDMTFPTSGVRTVRLVARQQGRLAQANFVSGLACGGSPRGLFRGGQEPLWGMDACTILSGGTSRRERFYDTADARQWRGCFGVNGPTLHTIGFCFLRKQLHQMEPGRVRVCRPRRGPRRAVTAGLGRVPPLLAPVEGADSTRRMCLRAARKQQAPGGGSSRRFA